jgi:hypothetical protein
MMFDKETQLIIIAHSLRRQSDLCMSEIIHSLADLKKMAKRIKMERNRLRLCRQARRFKHSQKSNKNVRVLGIPQVLEIVKA